MQVDHKLIAAQANSSPQGIPSADAWPAGPLYTIHVQDNRSYMVGSCDVLDPAAGCPACQACGFRIDPDFTAPNFRLRSKRYDLSCCHDGAIIASQRFREACERIGAGIRLRFVPLDDAAMGTELQGLCPACNRYANRTGFRHAVPKPGQAVQAHELAFSQQRYGSRNEAIALLLAGGGLWRCCGARRSRALMPSSPCRCELVAMH